MSTNRPAAAAKPASARTQAMRQGRQADTDRRRQRVLIAINQATETGAETSVSAVARAAGVDRTFIYRHHDLLENLHAQIRTPTFTDAAVLSVTRASLQADLLAAHERAATASTPASSTWRDGSPRPSATRSGAIPGSPPPLTLTPSISRSPAWSSRSSTYASPWKNATKTSPRPAPPTVNS
jgi:hypothetical protein